MFNQKAGSFNQQSNSNSGFKSQVNCYVPLGNNKQAVIPLGSAVQQKKPFGFDTKKGVQISDAKKNLNEPAKDKKFTPLKPKNPKIDSRFLVCSITALNQNSNTTLKQLRSIYFLQNGPTALQSSTNSTLNTNQFPNANMNNNQFPNANNNNTNTNQFPNANMNNNQFANTNNNTNQFPNANINNNQQNASTPFGFANNQQNSNQMGGFKMNINGQNSSGSPNFNMNQTPAFGNLAKQNNPLGGFNTSQNNLPQSDFKGLNTNTGLQSNTFPSFTASQNSNSQGYFQNNLPQNSNIQNNLSTGLANNNFGGQNFNLGNSNPVNNFSANNTQNNAFMNLFAKNPSVPSLFGDSLNNQNQLINFQQLIINLQKSVQTVRNSKQIAQYLNDKNRQSSFQLRSQILTNQSNVRSGYRMGDALRQELYSLEQDLEYNKRLVQNRVFPIRKSEQKKQEKRNKQIKSRLDKFRKKIQIQANKKMRNNPIYFKQDENIQHISNIYSQDLVSNDKVSIKDLPIINGFQIQPSIEQLSNYSVEQLQNVAYVTIKNNFGEVIFQNPINLHQKQLKKCIIIRQNEIQIMDNQWIQYQTHQLVFYNFGHYAQTVSQSQREKLWKKIQKWINQNKKMNFLDFNQKNGDLTVQAKFS